MGTLAFYTKKIVCPALQSIVMHFSIIVIVCMSVIGPVSAVATVASVVPVRWCVSHTPQGVYRDCTIVSNTALTQKDACIMVGYHPYDTVSNVVYTPNLPVDGGYSFTWTTTFHDADGTVVGQIPGSWFSHADGTGMIYRSVVTGFVSNTDDPGGYGYPKTIDPTQGYWQVYNGTLGYPTSAGGYGGQWYDNGSYSPVSPTYEELGYRCPGLGTANTSDCPAHASGTPCTCDAGYEFDSTGTSCILEQYTLSLEESLKDLGPSGTTDVYANTSSTVYAQVVDAQTNQPKAGVQVQFSVDVVARTGGHDGDHYQMRPKGKLLDCGSGSEVETTVCITQQDGRATVTFNAPVVSGTHTITAECVSPTCTGTASGDINVKVPGLEPMPYSTLYVFVGGETGKAHMDNHYLTPAASGKIQQLSEDYHSRFPFSPVLRVNDASLVWGGVLDINGSWTVPHIQHRRGMVIDVRANQLPDAIPNSNDFVFQDTLKKLGGRWILEGQGTSNEHYHILLLGTKG